MWSRNGSEGSNESLPPLGIEPRFFSHNLQHYHYTDYEIPCQTKQSFVICSNENSAVNRSDFYARRSGPFPALGVVLYTRSEARRSDSPVTELSVIPLYPASCQLNGRHNLSNYEKWRTQLHVKCSDFR
jgi:hypothetical protein